MHLPNYLIVLRSAPKVGRSVPTQGAFIIIVAMVTASPIKLQQWAFGIVFLFNGIKPTSLHHSFIYDKPLLPYLSGRYADCQTAAQARLPVPSLRGLPSGVRAGSVCASSDLYQRQ